MSIVARHHRYAFADYLAVEGMSVVKHEFFDGEIYAMAGGSARHAALAMALGATLVGQLRGGPCRVYSSDLRVRVQATGLATYPDVSVVCGPVDPDPQSAETVINPTLLVEVLSDSTREYDLGEKFDNYREIPSLRAVVFVWQEEPLIEVRERSDDGWVSRQKRAGEVAAIDGLGLRLAVDEIYRDATPPSR